MCVSIHIFLTWTSNIYVKINVCKITPLILVTLNLLFRFLSHCSNWKLHLVSYLSWHPPMLYSFFLVCYTLPSHLRILLTLSNNFQLYWLDSRCLSSHFYNHPSPLSIPLSGEWEFFRICQLTARVSPKILRSSELNSVNPKSVLFNSVPA